MLWDMYRVSMLLFKCDVLNFLIRCVFDRKTWIFYLSLLRNDVADIKTYWSHILLVNE